MKKKEQLANKALKKLMSNSTIKCVECGELEVMLRRSFNGLKEFPKDYADATVAVAKLLHRFHTNDDISGKTKDLRDKREKRAVKRFKHE